MGRAGSVRRADLPVGARRELNEALHELHRRAGFPSARAIGDVAGLGHTTAHKVFANRKVQSRNNVMAVADALTLRVRDWGKGVDPDRALDDALNRIEELWQKARAEEDALYDEIPPELTPSPAEITAYETALRALSGTVLWYNDAKGFGFITADAGFTVFVHHVDIETDGFRTLAEGQRVEYALRHTPKGMRAEGVRHSRRLPAAAPFDHERPGEDSKTVRHPAWRLRRP
ncbi:hypothetical protein GCM10009663_57250 [Kitasatospora arboriphila]|uniref:CSD domain-containing protein n=1 Tax=Kitasatospora arboriphila TaxID=258052 RepID=A0ABN1TYZ9_9ACTN